MLREDNNGRGRDKTMVQYEQDGPMEKKGQLTQPRGHGEADGDRHRCYSSLMRTGTGMGTGCGACGGGLCLRPPRLQDNVRAYDLQSKLSSSTITLVF
jgi:hypothetical protein